ncbi:MAG: FkbM family methyltransferase [Candidatus Dependentiae bacterium]
MKKIVISLLLIASSCVAEYYSQVGQDKFVNEHYFKNMRNGTFVEIGAYNGVCFSNSYFFEKELGWKGLCIEPVPRIFADLKAARNCTCIQAAMAGTEGMMQFVDIAKLEELSGLKKFFDEEPHRWKVVNLYLATTPGSYYTIIDIPVITFNKTMDEHGITRVDYLSIDTEGSELDIIKSIDFDHIPIFVISVENNENTTDVQKILESKGFTFITKFGGFDDLYVNFANAPLQLGEK